MMKNSIVFLLIFCVHIVSAQNQIYEFWTELSCSGEMQKNTEYDFVLESKFQNSGLFTKSIAGEFGLTQKISKPISIGVSYKLSEKNKVQGFFPEHTVSLILGVKQKFGNVKFSYRNKFEISKDTYINEYEDLLPVYDDRNKIKIQYLFNDFFISPSGSIEFFNSCTIGSFYTLQEMRYTAELNFDLKNKFEATLGYMYKTSYSTVTTEFANVLSISLSKSF